jgi:hypothetical protein
MTKKEKKRGGVTDVFVYCNNSIDTHTLHNEWNAN